MKKYNLNYIISIETTPKEKVGDSDWYSIFEKAYAHENGIYYKRPTVILDFIDGSSKTIYCDTDHEAEREAERLMKLSEDNKIIWI